MVDANEQFEASPIVEETYTDDSDVRERLIGTIQKMEGDDFQIINEAQIQSDIGQASSYFYKIFREDPGSSDASIAMLEHSIADILDGVNSAAEDKSAALLELETQIYDLLDPLLRQVAIERISQGFEEDPILKIDQDRGFNFSYQGRVISGQFSRGYEIEKLYIDENVIDITSPINVGTFSEFLTRFNKSVAQIAATDIPFLSPVHFETRNGYSFDFQVNGMTYVASPLDVLKFESFSTSREKYERLYDEFTRRRLALRITGQSGAVVDGIIEDGDMERFEKNCKSDDPLVPPENRATVRRLIEIVLELTQLRPDQYRILIDEEGNEIHESLLHSELNRTYYRGEEAVKSVGGGDGHGAIEIKNLIDPQSEIKGFGADFILRKIHDPSTGVSYFYDKNGVIKYAEIDEDLFKAISGADGTPLFSFKKMQELNPTFSEKDYLTQLVGAIKSTKDYYRFEALFFPSSEIENKDINTEFPESLILKIREYGRKICGINQLESEIESKYVSINIETEDWSKSDMPDITNFRKPLQELKKELEDLKRIMGKINPIFLKNSGLRNIYIFDNWEGPGTETRSRINVGGYSFGYGVIGFAGPITEGVFIHELLHCADFTNDIYDNEVWGLKAHGPTYKFLYGKSGAHAIETGKADGPRPSGFVSAYAKYGGVNEDQAETAEALFHNYKELMQWAAKEPPLARKVAMTIKFFEEKSGGYMNKRYFGDLAAGRVDNDYWN